MNDRLTPELVLSAYCQGCFPMADPETGEISFYEEGLQGGLYGVALGKAFFGESMFHRKTDASKIALVALVQYLRAHQFLFLDTQWTTPHLLKFGTYEVPAEEYRKMLKRALAG